MSSEELRLPYEWMSPAPLALQPGLARVCLACAASRPSATQDRRARSKAGTAGRR